MSKIISLEKAVKAIPEGATVMLGGFYGVGAANHLLGEIVRQKKKDLTLITCEGGWPDRSTGILLTHGCLKKLVLSWAGNLTNLTEKVLSGEVELELNPQGTLIERIRAGGAGLGGVLTKAGLGTAVEDEGIGEKVRLNGEEWLYHTPLRADVGLVAAYTADTFGNLIFEGTENNFNECICKACDCVIAEIGGEIKPVGSVDKKRIDVSGVFVDSLIEGWKL
jgi:acetate CoA/acetoacetate CoA-transferase alpha subunit